MADKPKPPFFDPEAFARAQQGQPVHPQATPAMPPPRPNLDANQQRVAMLEIFEKREAGEANEFTPGQFIRQKWPALSSDQFPFPVMFLEDLPETVNAIDFCQDPRLLGMNHTARVFDCRIATLHMTQTGDLKWVEFLATSREFEPVPHN